MTENKIYSDDPLLRFKDTEVPPQRTKHDIDGALAAFEVEEILWKWTPHLIETGEPGEIYVAFKVQEMTNGVLIRVPVRIDCPAIWDRANKLARTPEKRLERVNWRISMRIMYHFIYNSLNTLYAMRSSKVVAFLGYIQTGNGQQVKDRLIPALRQLEALPERIEVIPPSE